VFIVEPRTRRLRADVLVRQVGVLAGRITDGVDVGASDVERGTVADEVVDRPERRLRDHDGMVAVELL
jgi:hypothetical protein